MEISVSEISASARHTAKPEASGKLLNTDRQTSRTPPSDPVIPSKSSFEAPKVSEVRMEGPEENTVGDDAAGESPRVRRGVDKETFFSNIELEREGEDSKSGSSSSGKVIYSFIFALNVLYDTALQWCCWYSVFFYLKICMFEPLGKAVNTY